MVENTSLLSSRFLLLFVLLFAICCGLGYPALNRGGERVPGLSDAQTYAAMVRGAELDTPNRHMQFRVLVPYMAKPFYWMGQGRVGTWDPAMFGLLVVNALFTAATAMLLLVIVLRRFGNYQAALGASLLFLLNFAVPNLRLAGLIDAGEGFFLLLMISALLEEKWRTLPIWAILGTITKESFVPFMIVLTSSWYVVSRRTLSESARALAWIVTACGASLLTITILHWSITGVLQSPWQFGSELHHNSRYLAHFAGSIVDRQLWYIFIWLLPLSLFRLTDFPRSWRVATATTAAAAFAMNSFYGGAPGTVGRALFSIAGPLLSASVAMFLFTAPIVKVHHGRVMVNSADETPLKTSL